MISCKMSISGADPIRALLLCSTLAAQLSQRLSRVPGEKYFSMAFSMLSFFPSTGSMSPNPGSGRNVSLPHPQTSWILSSIRNRASDLFRHACALKLIS